MPLQLQLNLFSLLAANYLKFSTEAQMKYNLWF